MPRDVLPVKREWSEPLAAIAGAVACPQCRTELEPADQGLQCTKCGAVYIVRNRVVDLRPGARQDHGENDAWSRHWDDANQTSIVQRFFSFYRKAVFARAVAYFVDRYFPRTGLLLEAGSGTSETSMRVLRARGRTLVALDLIPGVLERCHPVMDVRVAGHERVDGPLGHVIAHDLEPGLRELHGQREPDIAEPHDPDHGRPVLDSVE